MDKFEITPVSDKPLRKAGSSCCGYGVQSGCCSSCGEHAGETYVDEDDEIIAEKWNEHCPEWILLNKNGTIKE